jgi:hypothetical protein
LFLASHRSQDKKDKKESLGKAPHPFLQLKAAAAKSRLMASPIAPFR